MTVMTLGGAANTPTLEREMPKFDYTFNIETVGDVQVIQIASGYDIDINMSINHDPNWWLSLIRTGDGDYIVDVQIGNHNTVLLDADRDGCRGVDEDGLEVTAKGRYPVKVLSKAIGLSESYSHKIIYAMEAMYQSNKAA
jgi:hypothetical protein